VLRACRVALSAVAVPSRPPTHVIVTSSLPSHAVLAGTHDTQGVGTDERISGVLDAARDAGIKVAFHLEPYEGRTAVGVRDDVLYIHKKYGSHPALLRATPRVYASADKVPPPMPVFYVYDSYHVRPIEWAQVLGVGERLTLRGSPNDGVFIALWLDAAHGREIIQGGFDGAYTYFAAGAADAVVAVAEVLLLLLLLLLLLSVLLSCSWCWWRPRRWRLRLSFHVSFYRFCCCLRSCAAAPHCATTPSCCSACSRRYCCVRR
jgi:hypothetical protein